MLIICPNCDGNGTIERDAWVWGRSGSGHHTTRTATCEACDGTGQVEALCSVCSEPLDGEGDCPACQAYAVETGETYERPKPYVPSEEAALRIASPAPAKAQNTCELCGVGFSKGTTLTVVSASRRASHNLCAHCVRAIQSTKGEVA